MSLIRGLPERHFDYLVGVLFGEGFTVARACVVPVDLLLDDNHRLAQFVPHVNGWTVHLRDEVWVIPRVRDITAEVKAAQGWGR